MKVATQELYVMNGGTWDQDGSFIPTDSSLAMRATANNTKLIEERFHSVQESLTRKAVGDPKKVRNVLTM